MLAIDTNVVVRYLTGDHPRQSARARALVDGEDVFVSTTVLLETEWVLRSVYGFEPAEVYGALRSLPAFPAFRWKTPLSSPPPSNAWQAAWISPMRFTLGALRPGDGFVTFDQQFIRAARSVGVHHVRAP